MSIDFSILRSTVGRRIVLVFLLCALLPVGILSFVSFRSVSRELEEQSAIRLRRLTKTQLMGIVERLELLNVELRIVADRLTADSPVGSTRSIEFGDGRTQERLFLLEVRPVSTDGEGASSPLGSSPVRLAPDDVTLIPVTAPGRPTRVFLVRPVDSAAPERGNLWADVNPLFLWWGPSLENTLPPAAELCVLDVPKTTVLFCSRPSETLQKRLAEGLGSLGELNWTRNGTEFLASYRTANLLTRFGFDGLTVVVSQDREYLLSPLADFRRSFPPLIITSLGVVLLLTIGQIRRRLVPLQHLQAGTRRIAARDFTTRVQVESGDEFQQLAEDFNAMAERLGKQFGALRSVNEIVQAVLSALDRGEIVRSVLANFDQLLASRAVSVTLFREDESKPARIFLRRPHSGGEIESFEREASEEALDLVERNPQILRLGSGADSVSEITGIDRGKDDSVTVFPVFVDSRLTAMISAGFAGGEEPASDDLERARQLADQVAVAFSNSELLRRLEKLSQGTLTALARTIDAKSHWTAGHSERVARMAVRVGREMGLPEEDLDILERGSLLHDLGKIGVPSQVLDKPGPLTAAELETVRRHVGIGARILEPIGQLGSLVPLVLQHHERFDGKGYPDGLAGEQIDPLARVLSVVDVYDALRSPRPYRAAMDHSVIVRELLDCAGTQFDSVPVKAFVRSEAWSAGWPQKNDPAAA